MSGEGRLLKFQKNLSSSVCDCSTAVYGGAAGQVWDENSMYWPVMQQLTGYSVQRKMVFAVRALGVAVLRNATTRSSHRTGKVGRLSDGRTTVWYERWKYAF